MTIDKSDIERDIAHQSNMIRALRDRLRQRELQEAKLGLNVPPEIVQEIHDLTDRIQGHEVELRRLRSEAAVDQIPLIEVEYRSLLAQEWDMPRGRPTVAGTTRLELARLRLGISPLRAQELESEIREALASEQLLELIQLEILESLRDFLENQEDKEKRSRFSRKFVPFMRALRLHVPVVAPWLLRHIDIKYFPDVTLARKALRLNLTELSESEIGLLECLFTDLENEMADRRKKSDTPS